MASTYYLSKSKLTSGAQCPKRLWLEVHHRELLEFSDGTERSFQIGHQVGDAAQSLYPEGRLIGGDLELSEALTETESLLAKPGPVTLFEATFQAQGILIRADILVRNEAGEIHLIEVKAATKLKPYYVLDCAIQLWVLQQLGYSVTELSLAHINNQFVYPGNGDYDGLFTLEDVLDPARAQRAEVERLIESLGQDLEGDEPDTVPGPQCSDPFDCPFIGYCSPVTTEYPLTCLGGSKRVQADLQAEGYEDVRDIPLGRISNGSQARIHRITLNDQPELQSEAAKALSSLDWPRYYFDFETLAPAVPIWAGTGPYKAQPFQWSCHTEYPDGALEHQEFLADGRNDPQREVAESLIDALETTGPIMVYTSYEKGMLENLAARFPDLADALLALVERLYDLHPLTRSNYYHPDMRGSWSIKKVLPCVAPDLDYSQLEGVSDGMAASNAFETMVRAGRSPEQCAKERHELLEYCKLDTLAMVRLAHFLEGRPG